MTPGTVRAPMASTVVEVQVAAGDAVQAGQTLLIVEAMKMEHELRAEADGRVEAVLAQVGENVEAGDVLLRIVPMQHEARAAATPDGARASPASAPASARRASGSTRCPPSLPGSGPPPG